MPTFKIWNAARDVRKTVQADSVAELCLKGGEKLGLKGPLKIVLKTDGTEIEDDSVLLDPRGLCSGVDVVLILLQVDECWSKKFTKQRQKNFPSKPMSGTERLLSVISQHSAKLRNFIDPDFGLLEELLRRKLLNEESYAKVQKSDTYFKKNDNLIRYIKQKTKEEELQGFLDALRNTDQSHVVNYILANGEHLEMCYGRERPLNTEEMNQLGANGPFLLKNVIVNEELLADLLSSKCITREHQEHVKAQCPQMKRFVELRTILLRRSASALQKFIDALYGTHQKIAADVLSHSGVAVPVHVDVTSNRPTRDLKVVEEDLAIKLKEFAKTLSEGTGAMEKKRKHYEKIKDLWLEMELNGIRYLSSKRGNSVAVYFWCRSRSSMTHLCRMRDSGDLGFLMEETMQLLVDKENAEKLAFSLKVIDQEWNLAKCYFQASENHAAIVKPSPFEKLPKELLEIILMRSFLSFYNSTWGVFPFTDFNPYNVMTSICSSWRELINKRRWFKSTVRQHLAKYSIIQRNSVLDILPKEIVELILMRSLLSAVHIPWENSFSSMPYKTVLMMASVCQQWHELLSQRTWFASTLKNYMRRNSHIATIQENSSLFDQCLDVDFYFLYEMLGHGLLSEEQLLEIGSESDRPKQIKLLYTEVLLKFHSENYTKFRKVLQSTGQNHISGYIQAKGVINPEEHDERPLSAEEMSRIDAAQLRLTDFVPPCEFLNSLASCDCITKNQVSVINSFPDNLKMSELLGIVGRRSYAALKQFAAHLRKMDQYADVAQILTTDSTDAASSKTETCDEEEVVEKSGQEYDLKEIECAFADKLIEIGRFIESGGTITVQDLNEIRSFWMLLERLLPDPDSAEVELDMDRLCIRPEIDSPSDCLTTDCIGYNDQTTQLVWSQDDNSDIYSSYDQSTASCLRPRDTHSNRNLAKLRKSLSYTSRRQTYWECLQNLYELLIKILHLQVQKEQCEDKSHDMETDAARNISPETEGTCDLICQLKLNPSVWKKLQHIACYLSPRGFLPNLSEIEEVIYKRSKSVENFSTCKDFDDS